MPRCGCLCGYPRYHDNITATIIRGNAVERRCKVFRHKVPQVRTEGAFKTFEPTPLNSHSLHDKRLTCAMVTQQSPEAKTGRTKTRAEVPASPLPPSSSRCANVPPQATVVTGLDLRKANCTLSLSSCPRGCAWPHRACPQAPPGEQGVYTAASRPSKGT